MHWLNEFVDVGRELYEQSLNHAASGNMSLRKADDIYITAHDTRLGKLNFGDIIRVNIADEKKDKNASVEVKVHRQILRETQHLAVVHAHPIWCTALSLLKDSIVPPDAEGYFYFQKVPVIEVKNPVGSEEMAAVLPGYLKEFPIVMVRGHGSFAAAKDLRTAGKYTAVLEKSAQIALLAALGKNFLS